MDGHQVTSSVGVAGGRNGADGKPRTGLAPTATVADLLNDAPRSRFHRRAVLISGMGFFTDAYDLFVISTVAVLVKAQWHLSTTQTSWVAGSTILAAFIGALVFGRIADVLGRKSVYVLVALIMIVGAVASAFATGFLWLVVARFVLGLGIGGDYPVSAVLMSEYANRDDRGRLVGLVFSMQALGLIVGPLVGLALLSSGISHDLTWRLMLGLGRCPPARSSTCGRRCPSRRASRPACRGTPSGPPTSWALLRGGDRGGGRGRRRATTHMGLGRFLTDRRMLLLLAGTAGSWFLFDYAYYGNTLSLPAILKEVAPHATLITKLLWTLGIFMVFAVPGYLLAFTRMDRIGHRRLQLIGFAVMAASFVALAAIPALTTVVAPFLAHLRDQLLLHRVRPQYDDVRAAFRAVPGQHADHRPRHRRRHRQARGLHRGLPRPAAREGHRPAGHAARGRGLGRGRLPPDPGLARAGWSQSRRGVRRGQAVRAGARADLGAGG